MLSASLKTGQNDPLAAYEYDLPTERIAQYPAPRRVQARMMVLRRASEEFIHQKVAHLTRWLNPGDLLVLNDTKVIPARLRAVRPTGGGVEILLLRPAQPVDRDDRGGEIQEVLLRSHRTLPVGSRLQLAGKPPVFLEVIKRFERGRAFLRFPGQALALAQSLGQVPLPPYIKRPDGPGANDRERYQTVYAGKEGAVAAPTAGLHLSRGLLAALERRKVGTARLTLHVGYGTFAEPSAEDLAAGRLHAEWVEVPEGLSRAVAETKAAGGRVVAVGTTSLRALEWRVGPGGVPRPGQGWCNLLIGEGFRFKVVDGLLTNFHLPRTTLLMLVAALAGRGRMLKAYAEAVEKDYRFYSFGDAMLIL